MSALRPDSNKGHDLGSSSVKWGTLHVGDVQAETITTSGSVEIQGNLTVTGSQTALSVTTVEADDPLIKLAKNNTADTVDIGFYGLTNDGASNQYHGLARDADDEKFYLFKDASEPTTVMPSLASQNTATLVANVEGNILGDLTGNASTATALETARDISLSGDVAGIVSFDGTGDVDIVATIQEDAVENSMILNPGYVYSDGVGAAGLVELGQTITIQGTTSEIEVSRLDGSFTIGLPTNVSGLDSLSATSISGALTGNASTATALQNARTLSISGDVAGSVSFDGTGNADIVSTIQSGSVENSMLANDGFGLKLGGVAQEDINLGDELDFVAGQDLDISYNAALNALTFSLEATIDSNTTGNAATATALETSRNFSVSSSEMTAPSVAFDATGNVQLVPSLVSGSVANSKLANSNIGFSNGVSSSDIELGGNVTIQGTSAEVEVDYSAGTFTIGLPDTIVADVTGNASTATALETARSFSIGAGPVQASGVSFDGTGNVSLTTTIANDQITNAMLENDKLVIQVDSVDYDRPLGSTLKFASGGDLILNYSVADNKITYNLPSNLTANTSGNAATATALETSRTFSATAGPVRFAAQSFDGSSNVAFTTTIEDGSIGNAKLENDGFSLKLGGVAQEDINLGDSLDFSGTASQVSISYDATNNDLTFSLPSTINVDTSGNAATATAQEIARDFSIESTEMSASAVSYDATGNVVLSPALKPGSVQNIKLANSDIGFGNGIAASDIALGGDVIIQGTSSEVEVGYSAGTFTIGLPDTIFADVDGNASTATALETARTLSLSGDVAGSVSFDGSQNVDINAVIQNGSVENSMLANASITIGDGVTSEAISLGGEFEIKGTASQVDVTYSDINNDFVIGLPSSINVNSATATALETARTLSISGDASGSVSFDGTSNADIAITIGTDAVENSMILNDHLSFTDGTTSSNVALGGTLTVQGTASEVEVSQSGGTFTLGLPNNVSVTSNLNVGGNITASSAVLTVDSIIALSNLTVGGNLTANGASVSFKDNLVELGVNNTDIEDIGFYGQRGDGNNSLGFAGFAWDESIDKFVAFTATDANEPSTVVGAHSLAELSVKNVRIANEYEFPTADGTDGQVLTTNGAGQLAFESIPAQSLQFSNPFLVSGSSPLGLADQSASYTHSIVIYTGTSADQATATLPSGPENGYQLTLKNTDSTNTWKYQRGGSDTIEGSSASFNLLPGEAVTLVFLSTTWYRIGSF